MIKNKTWVEIDLPALRKNYKLAKDTVHRSSPDCRVISVVKANAYGHGVERCVKALMQEGCDFFAVSSEKEALTLREITGNSAEILILGYTPEENAIEIIKNNIITTVHTLDFAEDLNSVIEDAVKRGELPEGKKLKVHIKLNTGMNRIGFSSKKDSSVEDILKVAKLPYLDICGIFTHFACADIDNGAEGSMTDAQLSEFMKIESSLSRRGLKFKMKHVCNSAATMTLPRGYFDAVRFGISLYGLSPDGSDTSLFSPVMSLHTTVSQVYSIDCGDGVSYGSIFRAEKTTKIAALTVGYGDGLFRAADGVKVLINGKLAPIVGHVCMDQCMIDVSGIDCRRGDHVTVFGFDSGEAIRSIAERANTINYEVVCAIHSRVAYTYKD